MSRYNPSAYSPPYASSHTENPILWNDSPDLPGPSPGAEPLDDAADLFEAFGEEDHFYQSLRRLPSPPPRLPQDPFLQDPFPLLRSISPQQQHQPIRLPPIIRLSAPQHSDSFPEGDRTQQTTTTSQNTRESTVVDLTESSPSNGINNDTMPPRKRKAETPGEGRASKVTRTNTSRSTRSTPAMQLKGESPEMVDLVDIDDDEKYEDFKAKQQAELIKQQQLEEATKPVKLVEFQCIICMDNPTDLTVTHCGHLFCSECLHQALHAGIKKCCPVCRTVISTILQGKEKRQPKNGVFVLEMKLTTTKRGKQPA